MRVSFLSVGSQRLPIASSGIGHVGARLQLVFCLSLPPSHRSWAKKISRCGLVLRGGKREKRAGNGRSVPSCWVFNSNTNPLLEHDNYTGASRENVR